jgi:DNA-binding GntR family transcriptional regulator
MLKGTTQWQVAQGIAEYIIDHDLAPGARIVEQALANRLGVSRTPVRAVLSHLRENGVLAWEPGRGFSLRKRLRTVEDAGIGDPTAGRVYDRILLDILNGSLQDTVSENALMRRYDIARGELSAALRLMTREGLAEPAPGYGWTFVQFSGEIVQKGYRLRMMIEPNVLLEPEFAIDGEMLQGLREAHTRILDELSDETSWDELFGLDARFHETLAAGSGNELVVETIQKQNRIRRLNEFLGYERLDRVRASLGEHIAILDSLAADDREWAATQLRQHLRKSLNQSVNHYQQDLQDFRSGRRRFAPNL